MYAIILTSGKHYKIEKGSSLIVDKINNVKKGHEVVFNDVLLFSDDKKVLVGKPTIDGATVIAKVVSQKKAPKVLVFKKKPKKGYKKLYGHRQYLTELTIVEINV
ncbi:MAG: 50S ribosomal protein L21 [Endomicrobium sp.]|jgi:large subunit ribosomal protein L21|nr:50S ribosomal protein L21 [Endomicrobium sp.]